MVKKEILEANPHLHTKDFGHESDMVNLLPVRSRPGATKQDYNAKCSKMGEVFRLLSRAWALVDKCERKGTDVELARLIEKSVFMLGQAFVVLNVFRSTPVLSRLLGKEKKAVTLTCKNKELLAKN